VRQHRWSTVAEQSRLRPGGRGQGPAAECRRSRSNRGRRVRKAVAMGIRSRPGRGLAGLVVVLLTAISACSSAGSSSSSSAGGVVHLTFWTWVPNIANAVNLFNSTHKNIQVTLDTIPTGSTGGYAKMLAAVKAGNPPCDAQVEYQEIPTFLLQNALVDIKQWASAESGTPVATSFHGSAG